MAKRPILNLDDLVDAPQVQIDGKSYSLRNQQEISPLEAHRYRKLGKRLDELISKEDLTESEEAELESIPKRLCLEILNAPSEVIEKLRDSQRMQIIHAFTGTLTDRSRPAEEIEAQGEQTTGAAS